MTQVTDLLASIDAVRYNPMSVKRALMTTLDEFQDGTRTVVDPTNPYVHTLETSVVTIVAAMIDSESNTRKQYARMALTEDELYMHMSDRDFINRFSSPSRGVFSLLLDKDEVYAKAIPTGVGAIRKLVIPRNTKYQVAGYAFTMQYPIEIRIMGHGGLNIVYDVTRPSPLQTLASNVVDWSMASYAGTDFIRLDIPVQQFEILTKYASLNESQVFSKTYDLTSKYCYCRVYQSEEDSSWTEILTTHTDQVFDPATPTALLKVFDTQVSVTIPQVYFATKLLNKELRIDIYQTTGPLDLILSDYAPQNFKATWTDLENDDKGIYFAPLGAFTTYSLFADSTVSGGTDPLTFAELRERVLNNALGNNQIPITNAQASTALEDLGYQLVVNVDNITNRNFLATRRLPQPLNQSVASGAGCSIRTLETNLDFLLSQSTVYDNGSRITLTPDTLYEDIGGRVEVVADVRVTSILAGDNDAIALDVNSNKYLYSPFYYVLDSTDNAFESRGYYLDAPSIDGKAFIEENDTLGLELSAGTYELQKTRTGFVLSVLTTSSDVVKTLRDDQIHAQLHFTPVGENNRAYLNGTLIGDVDGERLYEFNLGTNYDITSSDLIALNSFIMFNNEPGVYYAGLDTQFELLFAVSDYTSDGATTSAIDLLLGHSLLPADVVGVVQEQFRIVFGTALRNLWANSRSVISSIKYETYDVGVYATWAQNEYQRDSTGHIVWTVDAQGNLVQTLLHAAGDLKLADGQPFWAHEPGSPRLDPNTGLPIVANARGMLRQLDLFLVDGDYYFATEALAAEYKAQIPATVVGWLQDDIATLESTLLEQTNLYFYPQSGIGTVEVVAKEGATLNIEAEQRMKITYYLTKVGYNNAELLKALTSTSVTTLATAFNKPTVTTEGIEAMLRAQVGDDVIAIAVNGLGGTLDLASVMLADDSARLAIRKKPVALPNGTITVQDDVDVVFVRHEVL